MRNFSNCVSVLVLAKNATPNTLAPAKAAAPRAILLSQGDISEWYVCTKVKRACVGCLQELGHREHTTPYGGGAAYCTRHAKPAAFWKKRSSGFAARREHDVAPSRLLQQSDRPTYPGNPGDQRPQQQHPQIIHPPPFFDVRHGHVYDHHVQEDVEVKGGVAQVEVAAVRVAQ
eukprot:CAMPEP_0181348240 /NCGR_PEP_ID=MMETSP1106-20121128/67_1 /TAXON_ID=81844 /ORGANISM="Mantoniella antarctica, Strain SL-175" /LENGTH=172 /DNA_ID=CAMNT_0023460513 /DNA_START=354 /DNA_END=871 /DNA_ORIENTATION=+